MYVRAQGVPVSPEWLVLREPAGAAARSAELAEHLGRHLSAAALVIHDLGGGSGAMGRWLAPQLPGPQHWVVHDRDAGLLEACRRRCARPGRRRGPVTVEARRSDIIRLAPGSRRRESHRRLGAARHADRRRARRDARRLRRNRVLSHAARAYRRRSRRPDPRGSPGRPLGRRVQRPPTPHDDGGALLGPDAVAAAVDELRGTGAELVVRPSPWRLDAAHADLTAEWFGGWAAAACEQEPALAAEARAYRDRRLAQAAAGARRHRRPCRPAGAAVTTAVDAGRSTTSRRPWVVGETGRRRRDARRIGLAAGHDPFLDGVQAVDGGPWRLPAASPC